MLSKSTRALALYFDTGRFSFLLSMSPTYTFTKEPCTRDIMMYISNDVFFHDTAGVF